MRCRVGCHRPHASIGPALQELSVCPCVWCCWGLPQTRLTFMMGGARHPHLLHLSRTEAQAQVPCPLPSARCPLPLGAVVSLWACLRVWA